MLPSIAGRLSTAHLASSWFDPEAGLKEVVVGG